MAPPATYSFLVLATLLLAPWVIRAARTESTRRTGYALLGSMLVFEVGLIVLYYSLVACAALTTVALALAIAPLRFPGRWKIAFGFAAFSALVGAAFVTAPQEHTFFVYFASALPFLFLAAFGMNVASLIRWKIDRHVAVPAFLMLGFAALIPASSFLLFFLEWFEAAHLPITIIALLSLRRLLASAGGKVEDARGTAIQSQDIAAFLDRPEVRSPPVALAWSGVFLGTSILAWQTIEVGAGFAAGASFTLLLVGCVLPLVGRLDVRLPLASVHATGTLFTLLGILSILTDVAQHARTIEPFELGAGVRLVLGSVAAWMVGAGLIYQFARAIDEATRRRWAASAVGVVETKELARIAAAAGGILEISAGETHAEIEALGRRRDATGAPFAILQIRPPRAGWTVPDDLASRAGANRIHLAVVEGPEAFLSPPLVRDLEAR